MVDTKYYHVYPVNDMRKHELHGLECWCTPDLVEDNIVVHNSFDGREETKQ